MKEMKKMKYILPLLVAVFYATSFSVAFNCPDDDYFHVISVIEGLYEETRIPAGTTIQDTGWLPPVSSPAVRTITTTRKYIVTGELFDLYYGFWICTPGTTYFYKDVLMSNSWTETDVDVNVMTR